MSINWNSIGDLTIVNNLIKAIQRDKRNYQLRVTSAGVRTENSVEDNTENADEAVTVQNQLDAANALMATLTPGSKAWKVESIKVNKLTAQKTQLELDSETVGDEALALRAYRSQKTEALLAVANVEEASGIARRTALGG